MVASLALTACQRPGSALTLTAALLPSELPAYRAVVSEFERQSGLRVIVVPQQYADIRRALAAEAAAGTGSLDLVELDVYSLAKAAKDVAILDESKLQSELAAMGRIDGLRFLPHRVSWQALIYNHDVLGEPPATWDELRAVARAHPKQIGFKGALYEGLTCDILPFVWAAGGSGERFDDRGAVEAFELFADLAPYLNPQSATFKESTIVEAMARGEIVLQLNWPFAMSLYASQGLAPGTIRSAPLPRGPAGQATVLGGGYLAIPRHAPNHDAALQLARYLIGHSAQSRLQSELGWFSARSDVPLGGDSELLSGFAAMRNFVRPRPERSDYPRLSRLWQQAFRDVVFEGADPESALDIASDRLSSLSH
jgi:ABC-type glycerol-3-phosphate transport system substrate-binding protein